MTYTLEELKRMLKESKENSIAYDWDDPIVSHCWEITEQLIKLLENNDLQDSKPA